MNALVGVRRGTLNLPVSGTSCVVATPNRIWFKNRFTVSLYCYTGCYMVLIGRISADMFTRREMKTVKRTVTLDLKSPEWRCKRAPLLGSRPSEWHLPDPTLKFGHVPDTERHVLTLNSDIRSIRL